MGPEPKNNRCPTGDCTAARFRREDRERKNPFKSVKFQDYKLIVPTEVIFGDFPVPDSCCVQKSRYCGLKNNFKIYQRMVFI